MRRSPHTRKYRALNPRAAGAQVAIAQLQLRRGRATDAVSSAEDALKNAPALPDARLALVRGLLAKGDLKRAESELTRLIAAYPDSAPVREQYRRAAGASEKHDGCTSSMTSAHSRQLLIR